MSDTISVSPVVSTATQSKAENMDVSMPMSASERLSAKQEAVEATKVEETAKESADQEVKEVKQDPLASKFAALTKRQRELVQKEQQLKELESKYKPLEETIQNAKANPLKLLEQAGISTEEFLQFIINDGDQLPEEDTVETKLAKLEKKIAEKEEIEFKAVKEQEQARITKQINDFKDHINSTIQQNADKYELVSSSDASDVVYDVILQHFNETAVILPVEEALEQVEKYLEQEAAKLLKTQKLSAKLSTQTQQANEAPQAKKVQGMQKTLSNSATAPVPATPVKQLTAEEKKERAIAMLRFK